MIGTAISLNILIPQLPLSAACAISVAETLAVLLFYQPDGKLRRIRLFELFIALLVLAVFVTICVTLAMVSAPAGQVLKGFLPSRDIFVSEGLYQSCALLGGSKCSQLFLMSPHVIVQSLIWPHYNPTSPHATYHLRWDYTLETTAVRV